MVTVIILKRNDDVRLSADFIQPLEQSIPDVIKKICWVVRPDVGVNDFLDKLKRILEDNYGDTQTEIGFLVDDNHVVVTNIAGSLSWKVGSNDFLQLRHHPSIANVEIATNIPYSLQLHIINPLRLSIYGSKNITASINNETYGDNMWSPIYVNCGKPSNSLGMDEFSLPDRQRNVLHIKTTF